jgi:paraquat-inducible protein B
MTMTEGGAEPDPPPALPEPVLSHRDRLRFSLVWVVPLLALVVGAVLVVRSFLQQGPEITISFRNAEGLEAGRTEVRFKEVVVGRVLRVSLSPDRQQVLVRVRLDRSAAGLAVEDTRFWVVRPRVGTGGVSGLGTLLSGSYIGVDAGVKSEEATDFIGLDSPPLVLRGEPGRSFLLRADNLGSLDVGSPVYFKRYRVGRVVGYALDRDGRALSVQVFIESPNESLVTTDSRFWNASGIELQLNASGLTVNTQSVASLLAGGIAFGSPPGAPAAPAAAPGRAFRLFDTERAALAPEDGPPLQVRMRFGQSLRGLDAGAPIDLLGIEVGTVRRVTLGAEIRNGRILMEVTADLYPTRLGRLRERFGASGASAAARDRQLLRRLVDAGLRAQVRDGNLLTGSLYVALDFVPKAASVKFDPNAEVPWLPTVPGTFSDVQTQLAETIERLSKVKFDEIGAGFQDTIKSANAAAAALQRSLDGVNGAVQQLTPETQRTLDELRRTLASVQQALGHAESNLLQLDAPLQRQTAQTLAELQRAAQALRTLADSLQRHPESLLRGRSADTEPLR